MSKVWLGAIVALSLAACGPNDHGGQPKGKFDAAASAKAEWEAANLKREAEARAKCVAEKDAILDRFNQHFKAREFTKAKLATFNCGELTRDAAFVDASARAALEEDKVEVAKLLKQLTSNNKTTGDRMEAYRRLTTDYKDSPAFVTAKATVQRYKSQFDEWNKLEGDYRRAAAVPSIGMSQDQLIALKGYPSRSNRTVTTGGESLQWIYCKSYSSTSCMYVYLHNGVVTSYQD